MVAKSFNSCITLCNNYIITICISITSILTTQALLKSGDIETNPGPKKSSAIRFCHWNLNGLLMAFITAHNCDIVCLSETFLDSTVPDHDENLDLLLSNINDHHPACSVFIGDFNAKCSKWCTTD